MPGIPQRRHALTTILLLASVAACGTPPAAPGPGPASVSPSAGHQASSPRSGAPTKQSTSAPTTWVGRFAGKQVKIPYGHGAPVSFTFDDGPDTTYTPQVLALLKKNHTPAVFCLIGTEARAHPALVRAEVRAGHALCDHSRDHDLFMNGKGSAYVQAEVDDGLAAIQATAPRTPVRFYRQPGGTWSPQVVRAMDHAGLAPLRWNDDPRDWSRPGADVIVHRVVKKVRPGAVILLHDGGGDRSQTVKALAWLLPALQEAGWQPVLAPEVKLSRAAAAKPQ